MNSEAMTVDFPIQKKENLRTSEKRKFVELKLQTLYYGANFTETALNAIQKINTRFINGIYNYNDKTNYKIPHEFFFPDNTIVQTRMDMNSGYAIDYEEERFLLKKKDKILSQVFFPKAPEFYSKRTSDGIEFNKVIQLVGKDCIKIYPMNYCWYETIKKKCQFCNIDTAREMKSFLIRKKVDQILEACEDANKENLIGSLLMATGVFPTEDRGASVMVQIINGIRKITEKNKILGSVSIVPPKDRKYVKEIYDSGIEFLTYNMEVYDKELFEELCPAKAHETGWEGYLKEFEYAQQFFGRGKVRSNFVAGLEPLDSLVEGFNRLAEQGILPTATILYLQKGTEFAERKERPKIDYYRRVFKELSRVYQKHDLTPPWNTLCESHTLDSEGKYLE